MSYRLPSERVPIDIEAGPTVEVERVQADLLYEHGVGLASVFLSSKEGKPRGDALSDLYGFFILEAQPTWAIVDHRGVVPPTVAGMTRLKSALGVDMVLEWLKTHAEKETAVDKLVPPGDLRDQLNAKLAEKRRTAKAA